MIIGGQFGIAGNGQGVGHRTAVAPQGSRISGMDVRSDKRHNVAKCAAAHLVPFLRLQPLWEP